MKTRTLRGDRLHIGFFGRRNAGKSSLINAITGQAAAIVSDTPGTTTDPVFKAMELLPMGPVVLIDTAGIDEKNRVRGNNPAHKINAGLRLVFPFGLAVNARAHWIDETQWSFARNNQAGTGADVQQVRSRLHLCPADDLPAPADILASGNAYPMTIPLPYPLGNVDVLLSLDEAGNAILLDGPEDYTINLTGLVPPPLTGFDCIITAGANGIFDDLDPYDIDGGLTISVTDVQPSPGGNCTLASPSGGCDLIVDLDGDIIF